LRVHTLGELRDDVMGVLNRVAEHVGMEFKPKSQRWFDKWLKIGLSKKKKSHGKHPPQTEALLNEMYAPHNKRLIELLTSLPFQVNREALEAEFGGHHHAVAAAEEHHAEAAIEQAELAMAELGA
jgi:hypothetical protein